MQERFKLAHQLHYFRGWRRDKRCGSRSGAANPVLTLTELTRSFFAAPTVRQQDIVNLANESKRKRKPFANPGNPVRERGHVVGYFLDVSHRDARSFGALKNEQIGERGLRLSLIHISEPT